jgi:hypothetical protein
MRVTDKCSHYPGSDQLKTIKATCYPHMSRDIFTLIIRAFKVYVRPMEAIIKVE